MNNKKKILTGCIGCISLTMILWILLCVTAYQLFFNNCLWWNCAPERGFSIYDLNLPEKYFPVGSFFHSPVPYNKESLTIEVALSGVEWEGGGAAGLFIWQYAMESHANKYYTMETKSNRFTSPMENPEKYSDLVSYKTKFTDYSFIDCGYLPGDFRCEFVAQYQEFLFLFYSSIDDGEMTKDNFLNVVKYIDSRMGELLGYE